MIRRSSGFIQWLIANILILAGIWLVGIRIGTFEMGGPDFLGTAGRIMGYGLLVSACVLMFTLIYRGKYP
jgi:hypothetical protein